LTRTYTKVGFNRCNETTLSQTSMCQTIVVNSIEDFCIYIPPTLMPVGNAEAGMVAACTKVCQVAEFFFDLAS